MMEKPQNDADWRVNKGVLQRNAYMFENSLWTDCTFKVINGDILPQIYKCHKNILASASCVFETMFFGLLKETDVITVTDIAPKTFNMMLRYIYFEEIPNTSFQDILSLGMAANKYMLMDLLKLCENKMESILRADNAIPALEFAKYTQCNHLMDLATKIIKTQTSSVILSEPFLSAERDTINALLQENDLSLSSEKILWDAVFEWTKHQFSKGVNRTDQQLRQVLQTFLPHFRFLTMTSEEFAEGPASSDILTNEECKIILMHIASSKIHIKFPTGFSPSRRNRCSTIFKNIQEIITSNTVEIKFSLTSSLKVGGLKFLCQTPFAVKPNDRVKLEVTKFYFSSNVQEPRQRLFNTATQFICRWDEVGESTRKNEFDFITESINFEANDDVRIVLTFSPMFGCSGQSANIKGPKSKIYWLHNTKYFLAILS